MCRLPHSESNAGSRGTILQNLWRTDHERARAKPIHRVLPASRATRDRCRAGYGVARDTVWRGIRCRAGYNVAQDTLHGALPTARTLVQRLRRPCCPIGVPVSGRPPSSSSKRCASSTASARSRLTDPWRCAHSASCADSVCCRAFASAKRAAAQAPIHRAIPSAIRSRTVQMRRRGAAAAAHGRDAIGARPIDRCCPPCLSVCRPRTRWTGVTSEVL